MRAYHGKSIDEAFGSSARHSKASSTHSQADKKASVQAQDLHQLQGTSFATRFHPRSFKPVMSSAIIGTSHSRRPEQNECTECFLPNQLKASCKTLLAVVECMLADDDSISFNLIHAVQIPNIQRELRAVRERSSMNASMSQHCCSMHSATFVRPAVVSCDTEGSFYKLTVPRCSATCC
jgi:hypothetical protein